MRKIIILLCVSFYLLGPAIGSCENISSTEALTIELEVLVAQWVEVQAELAAEQQSWEEQKKHLQSEKKILSTRIKELKLERNTWLEKKQRTQDELNTFHKDEQELNAVDAALKEANQSIQATIQAIPQSLLGDFENERPIISGSSTETRLQHYLATCTILDQWQRNIKYTKEVHQISPVEEQEVDVLYLGLSMGFAACDGWAAIGRPKDGGWAWEESPIYWKNIQKAVSVLKENKHTNLQFLPMKARRL